VSVDGTCVFFTSCTQNCGGQHLEEVVVEEERKRRKGRRREGTEKGGTAGRLTKEVKLEKNKREKTEEIEMIEV
jgi:hypothetical protein